MQRDAVTALTHVRDAGLTELHRAHDVAEVAEDRPPANPRVARTFTHDRPSVHVRTPTVVAPGGVMTPDR